MKSLFMIGPPKPQTEKIPYTSSPFDPGGGELLY
jgi:hypothetical protein